MKKRNCDRQFTALRELAESLQQRDNDLVTEIARLNGKVLELRQEIGARDELLRVARAERQAALDQKLYESTRHAQTQADLKRASEIVSERGKIMSILVEKIRSLETI